MYRTYSFLNLLKLEKLEEAVIRQEDFFVDQETLMSVYEGHTIFSLFISEAEVFEQIRYQF